MTEHVITLPDIGEGVAEAELIAWTVREGEAVKEDQTLAEVMTDKATIEIPSPVDGVVTWLGAQAGDKVAVGAPIVRLEIGEARGEPPQRKCAEPAAAPAAPDPSQSVAAPSALPLAAPALRARAKALGVDLHRVAGTGPEGRIVDADLDAYINASDSGEFEDIRVLGLRRKIAERMTLAVSQIPHITYVEEVDVTALEQRRAQLNGEDGVKLTLLPFLMRAMVKAVAEQPNFNAHYLMEASVLRRFHAVHIGVATQTKDGLVVPVVRDVDRLGLAECAAEISRLAAGAREGKADRTALSGSTITISSLGALGGLVTTPIINAPEVAIIGINKIYTGPVWDGAAFQPRRLMNISASFDHRVIDGWDAAMFIQSIKRLLEDPPVLEA